MKFLTWVLRQTARNDSIGDLARDFAEDHERPHACSKYSTIHSYLFTIGACDNAMRALKRAYAEYRDRKELGELLEP